MTGVERAIACFVTLVCLLGTPSLGSAQLIVIFDNGQARPLSVFLGPLETTEAEKEPVAADNTPLGAADLQSLLPIRSA